MTATTGVRLCVEGCGRPAREHRRLCTTCQDRRGRDLREGRTVPRPRGGRQAQIHFDDVTILLSAGSSLPEIASRLGVTAPAITRAITRACTAADAEDEPRPVWLARLVWLAQQEATQRREAATEERAAAQRRRR